jgi:hypothetical protein
MVLLNFIPDLLEMSSVLHVTLLVSLRLIAILKPTSYQIIHEKLRYNSIIVIWITSVLFHATNRVALILKSENFFYYGNLFVLLFCNILPVVLILIMYIMLIWVLRGKTSKSPETNTVELSTTSPAIEHMEKKMTLAVLRIVLVVILCYGPFLLWRAYFFIVIDRRIAKGTLLDAEVILILHIQISFNLNFVKLILSWLQLLYITYNCISICFQGYIVTATRLLFAINCFINPFIYAQSIPAFRNIVRTYGFCNSNT